MLFPIEITDHFSAAIALELDATNQCKNRKIRVFNHTNNICFTQLLNGLIPAIDGHDMNTAFESYWTKLLEIYDVSYPIVVKTLIGNTENGEWLTPRIKACVRKKAKLYRMYAQGRIYKEDYRFYAK